MRARFTLAVTAVIATLSLTTFAEVDSARPAAEVVHWWVSNGESTALNVFKRAHRADGGNWIDVSVRDSYTSRSISVSRMADGQSPSAMQWNAGFEAKSFMQLGFTREPLRFGIDLNTTGNLPDIVKKEIQLGDKFTGIPISIHAENWVWYSRQIYLELGLRTPRTWPELLSQAEVIRKAGYTPISLSHQEWQVRMIFNNILIAIAGGDAYRRFYVDNDPTLIQSQQFGKVLDTFLAVKPYTTPANISMSWDQALDKVRKHQAAMNFNGDWAKGEFYTRSLHPGRDYLCELAPGTESNFILVLDLFIFGDLSPSGGKQAQHQLARTLIDPKAQREFSKAKGSIPALYPEHALSMDECTKKSYTAMQKKDSVLPSMALIGDWTGPTTRAVDWVWKNADRPRDDLLTELRNAIVSARLMK